jgi:hypothetical protein
MGLDCYIYSSKHTAEELNEHACCDDVTDESETVVCIGCEKARDSHDLWYGRKTHTIMDMLLEHKNLSEDNCVHIGLNDVDLEGYKTLIGKETIQPRKFINNEYELDCFVDLVQKLDDDRKTNPDNNLIFYAWY